MHRLFPENPYSNCKVLIMGAGGIGSELAKTLILSGVKKLHVIDMDTIDVSNLNRQFLFRPNHVGMSKARVLKEQLERPGIEISYDHASVFESQYKPEFIEQFSLVFNALDNIPARKHINRLCLAAKVPLFDAGTNGFKGNASPILGKQTRCYECTQRPLPKQFPICSIRGFPNKLIHCVVWAKNLFEVLFGGEPNPDYLPSQLQIRLQTESKHAMVISDIGDYLFGTEIEEKKKKYTDDKLKLLKSVSELVQKPTNGAKVRSSEKKGECTTLSTFVEKGAALLKRAKLSFDKDDKQSMAFVVAATNLRALTHSIPTSNSFEIKQMAGNIVPAISSTNSLAASFQVQEAIKFLKGENPRVVYCDPQAMKHISSIDAIEEGPNPRCAICNNKTQRLILRVRSLAQFSLDQFVKEILKGKLSLGQPVIVADQFYYQDSPQEQAQNATLKSKSFTDLKLEYGTAFMIDDFDQKVQVEIALEVLEEDKNEEQQQDYELEGDHKIKAVADEKSETYTKIKAQIKQEDGFIAIQESSQEESSQKSKSRSSQQELIFGKKLQPVAEEEEEFEDGAPPIPEYEL